MDLIFLKRVGCRNLKRTSNSGQFEDVLRITTSVPSSNRISSTCLAKTSLAG